jgi:hypothetical protein
LVTAVQGHPDFEQRYRELSLAYAAATAEWPSVQRITGSSLGADEWISEFASGLHLYGAAEGW